MSAQSTSARTVRKVSRRVCRKCGGRKSHHAKLCRRCTAVPQTTHGCAAGNATKEYRAWRAMRARCLNPKASHFSYYGGRGVTVCPQWAASDCFPAFLKDVGPAPSPKHTLERIDNAKGYEPGNVRWATRLEQVRNRRNNVWVEFEGVRVLAIDVARRFGLWPQTVLRSLRAGKTIERAVGRAS